MFALVKAGSARKWLSLAAALCAVCLLAGCAGAGRPSDPDRSSPAGTVTPSSAERTLTLAYTATDSLNPYTAKTKTNQELGALLYDGLVVLNREMEADYALARDITVNGTQVTVELREAYFSDGSRITAEDVLASMNAAMEAEALSYAQDFENVRDKTVTENGRLSLVLAHEDPYFVNFLDFPVFKAGSEVLQNDDNKSLPPVGGGRYLYHEEAGEYWLTANPRWYGGDVSIRRIDLLNLPDEDAISHAVQVGTVDWYYSDLSDNTFPNMNGVSVMVPLPNLVFLGANEYNGVTGYTGVRRGISAAIDRTEIAETVYFGVATPAAGPYPAVLQVASGLQTISGRKNQQEAAAWFEQAGFTAQEEDGTLVNGNLPLHLRLVYNSDNDARTSLAQTLSAQLTAVGCRVTPVGLVWSDYVRAIQSGQYDLYIGEMRIPDNLDLYPLLTAGGLLTLNVSEPPPSDADADPDGADDVIDQPDSATLTAALAAYRYHTGRGSLTEMLSCMDQQLSVIPLCHRTGMLIYADFIAGTPTPVMGDPFCGIEHCTIQ